MCRPVLPVQPWGPGLHPTPLNWGQPTPSQDLRELGTARTRHRTRRLPSAQEASAVKFNLSPRGQSRSWLLEAPVHVRLWAAWRASKQGLEADMCLSTGARGAVSPALTTAALTAATGQSGESRAHHHLPPSPRVLLANPSLSFKAQDTPPPTGTSFPLGTYSSRKGCSGKSPSPLPGPLYMCPRQASKLLQTGTATQCHPALGLAQGILKKRAPRDPSLPPHSRALCQDHCAHGPSTGPALSRKCWTVLSTTGNGERGK